MSHYLCSGKSALVYTNHFINVNNLAPFQSPL